MILKSMCIIPSTSTHLTSAFLWWIVCVLCVKSQPCMWLCHQVISYVLLSLHIPITSQIYSVIFRGILGHENIFIHIFLPIREWNSAWVLSYRALLLQQWLPLYSPGWLIVSFKHEKLFFSKPNALSTEFLVVTWHLLYQTSCGVWGSPRGVNRYAVQGYPASPRRWPRCMPFSISMQRMLFQKMQLSCALLGNNIVKLKLGTTYCLYIEGKCCLPISK